MAHSYLRFERNGIRHSAAGESYQYCQLFMDVIHKDVQEGVIRGQRFNGLIIGDEVTVTLFRRRRGTRPNVPVRTIKFKVTNVVKSAISTNDVFFVELIE